MNDYSQTTSHYTRTLQEITTSIDNKFFILLLIVFQNINTKLFFLKNNNLYDYIVCDCLKLKILILYYIHIYNTIIHLLYFKNVF